MRRLVETLGAIALLAGAFLANVAGAATYNEGVDGDLSDNPAAPTAWMLEAGANALIGAAGLGTTADFDLIAFTVPAGHQLDSLTLNSFSNSGSYQSFLGMQAGAAWTTGFDFGVAGETLLGWVLFDPGDVGSNLLPEIGVNGAAFVLNGGFTPPLGSGTYTMLLQDTASQFTYGFTLNVSAVPEPATAGLAAIGLLGVCWQRRSAKPRAAG